MAIDSRCRRRGWTKKERAGGWFSAPLIIPMRVHTLLTFSGVGGRFAFILSCCCCVDFLIQSNTTSIWVVKRVQGVNRARHRSLCSIPRSWGVYFFYCCFAVAVVVVSNPIKNTQVIHLPLPYALRINRQIKNIKTLCSVWEGFYGAISCMYCEGPLGWESCRWCPALATDGAVTNCILFSQ